jgi:hypothetical protein
VWRSSSLFSVGRSSRQLRFPGSSRRPPARAPWTQTEEQIREIVYMKTKPGVWFATHEQIARYVKEQARM